MNTKDMQLINWTNVFNPHLLFTSTSVLATDCVEGMTKALQRVDFFFFI